MKSPFWPRTFRSWLALQLARLAAAVADVNFICDAGYRIALQRNWKQPTKGAMAAPDVLRERDGK